MARKSPRSSSASSSDASKPSMLLYIAVATLAVILASTLSFQQIVSWVPSSLLARVNGRHTTASPATDNTNGPLKCHGENCVLVIGSGLAGLSAAVEVEQAGVEVLVVEKEKRFGGNSAKASSGINAAGTPEQATFETESKADAKDSLSLFEDDVVRSGGGVERAPLVKALVKDAGAAVAWLHEKGAPPLTAMYRCGGHSAARTHRNTKGPNVGTVLTKTLIKHLESEEHPLASMHAQIHVDSLLTDPVTRAVIGVRYHSNREGDDSSVTYTCVARGGVVLASGGFGYNTNLLARYAPQTADRPTTNGPWALGEGLTLATDVGASLYGMEHVQVHPTGIVNPADRDNKNKFLAPEALRAVGGVLINSIGRRFVDELTTRDKVSDAILAQPNKSSCLVLEDAKGGEAFGKGILGFYAKKGFVRVAQNVRELASIVMDKSDVSDGEVAILSATLDAYKTATATGVDEFGKSVFPNGAQYGSGDRHFPMHVFLVTPSVHYTMGGVAIDEHAHALRSDGSVISGLYAAGEVSGGVHGRNRLAGNSLCECVVFGRRAGQRVAAAAKKASKK